jgi:hypothetical protein
MRPIEPTSAAITSPATASELIASANDVPPIEKINNTGRDAPAYAKTSVLTVAAMWSCPTSSAPPKSPRKRSAGFARRRAITVEAWLTVRSIKTPSAPINMPPSSSPWRLIFEWDALSRVASSDIQLVDVSQFAGVGGPGPNTLDGDSQAKGVTNFQRPEDGSWDPQHPNDFYFVTTSSFGPRPDENRTGETRLWRLRFVDPTDPSQGGTITLLVNGPVGTADSPSATGTQSAGSPGPQMFDNITVNDLGQVLMLEDVGNQAYLGGAWIYDISSGDLLEIAGHDPDRFTPGATSFLTKDEEMSGIIPAPFLGESWYLLDVQAHYSISGELVQGGQLLALHIPPGR